MSIDFIGVAAGFFIVLSFRATDPVRMRVYGIASNLLFIAYGLSIDLLPVWALHAILLPMNALRLWQALGGFLLAPRLDTNLEGVLVLGSDPRTRRLHRYADC